MAKVSVIVPVYNVEAYIEKCVRSLFGQTLDDIEYIFVDDCSSDNSIDILNSVLKEYPKRIAQTTIIFNEKNLGQGETRKKGILSATGEYVIHCDSDDWVEFDMYETMYRLSKESNADIVMCGLYKNFPNGKQIEMNMADDTDKYKAYVNLYTSRRMGSLCSHLVSRKIVQAESIIWPDWSYTEDLALIFQYVMNANKLASVKRSLYHYRDNLQSISYKKFETLYADILKTHSLIEEWCKEMNIWDKMLPYRLAGKFNQKARKLGSVSGSDREAQNVWLSTNPELGLVDLMRADLKVVSKLYAIILFMRLMPWVNKFINIRKRIWS